MSRPAPKPFVAFRAALGRYSPQFQAEVAAHGADGDWRLLALECRDRAERELCPDPILDYRPQAKRTVQRPPANRSTAPGRVRFDSNADPLKNGEILRGYLEATGTDVSSSGRFRCVVPQHEDAHPSAQLWADGRWKCWSCNGFGDVVDVAGFVTGRNPSGADYWWLRDHVLETLLRAPLPSERRSR